MKKIIILVIFCLMTIPVFAQFDESTETLVGEDIHHGGYIAPVLKFTEVKDDFAFLVGGKIGWLFNHVLQQRVEAGTWSMLQTGDVAALDGSGSIFTVEELDETLEARCRELDLHPTGPLWGESSAHQASELTIVETFPTLVAGLEKHTKAARRSLRLAVRDRPRLAADRRARRRRRRPRPVDRRRV